MRNIGKTLTVVSIFYVWSIHKEPWSIQSRWWLPGRHWGIWRRELSGPSSGLRTSTFHHKKLTFGFLQFNLTRSTLVSVQEGTRARACQSVELPEELARRPLLEVRRSNCPERNMSHWPLRSCTCRKERWFFDVVITEKRWITDYIVQKYSVFW